jgi:hypothetical protein
MGLLCSIILILFCAVDRVRDLLCQRFAGLPMARLSEVSKAQKKYTAPIRS